jgi:hypothetical protein
MSFQKYKVTFLWLYTFHTLRSQIRFVFRKLNRWTKMPGAGWTRFSGETAG